MDSKQYIDFSKISMLVFQLFGTNLLLKHAVIGIFEIHVNFCVKYCFRSNEYIEFTKKNDSCHRGD